MCTQKRANRLHIARGARCSGVVQGGGCSPLPREARKLGHFINFVRERRRFVVPFSTLSIPCLNSFPPARKL